MAQQTVNTVPEFCVSARRGEGSDAGCIVDRRQRSDGTNSGCCIHCYFYNAVLALKSCFIYKSPQGTNDIALYFFVFPKGFGWPGDVADRTTLRALQHPNMRFIYSYRKSFDEWDMALYEAEFQIL